MNDIRGNLLDLRIHYEQLIDFSQELEENENDFFRDENLRYFHMFTERVIRLQDMVTGQREYVTQLRDLIQSHLDVKQNRIMTVLTVITSIFLPLTLPAPDPHRGLVRHELPLHARAGMALRLSGHHRGLHPDCDPVPVLVQKEKVDVRLIQNSEFRIILGIWNCPKTHNNTNTNNKRVLQCRAR